MKNFDKKLKEMKGLSKYIIKSIIEHSTLDDFGQFLLMSRNVTKGFEVLISQLKKIFKHVNKGNSLCHVKYQTEKICIKAVERDAYNICFVKKETHDMWLAAVKQNGFALQFVNNQTNLICREAVKQNRNALFFVNEEFRQEVKRNEGSL